jgi:hypothetical protein
MGFVTTLMSARTASDGAVPPGRTGRDTGNSYRGNAMGATKTQSAGPANVQAATQFAGAVRTKIGTTGFKTGPTGAGAAATPEFGGGRTKTGDARRAHMGTSIDPRSAEAMGSTRPRPHPFFSVAGMNREADGAAPAWRGPKDTLQFHMAGADTDDQPWPPLRRLPRNA